MASKESVGDIPQVMKAVQAKDYGDIDENLFVEENVRVPRLGDTFPVNLERHPIVRFAEKLSRKDEMIIKTLAVALAPGDCRVLSGKTRRLQGPPSFPYVPGGDCSGIVVEIPPDETYFKVGDIVTARFTGAPRDAIAEYARISRLCCEKFDPALLSPEEAAALASASAVSLLSDCIIPGERLLILGANGGIGSHLCQLAKAKGASFVCGVSNDPKRLMSEPLNCDDAIDYTQEDVFDCERFKQKPFDTILDLSSGGWPKLAACGSEKIVKAAVDGGRYITTCPDYPTFEARTFFRILSIFVFEPMWRALTSRLFTRKTLPTYTHAQALPDVRDVVTRTLNFALEGKLKAVIDPKGPFPMTTEGVRQAFRLQESRHAKGKVVITVAKLDG